MRDTIPLAADLTDAEVNAMIAERCGWVNDSYGSWLVPPEGETRYADPTSSLDAIAAAYEAKGYGWRASTKSGSSCHHATAYLPNGSRYVADTDAGVIRALAEALVIALGAAQ